MFGKVLAEGRFHHGLCLPQVCTGFQPHDERHARPAVALRQEAGLVRRPNRQRKRDVQRTPRLHALEPRGGDPDDRDDSTAHDQRLTENLRVAAKSSSPVAVADDGDRPAAGGAVVLGNEPSPLRDRHPDQGVIVASDVLPDHPLLALVGRHLEVADVVPRDSGEDILAAADALQPQVVGGGDQVVTCTEGDEMDILRRGDGQRTKQHGVHQAEDRRVGADAERERGDGSGGKPRRASRGAHGVSHILNQCFEHMCLLATGFTKEYARRVSTAN